MPAAQQRQVAPRRDDRSHGTRLQRLVHDFTRYDNDNLQTGSAEELAHSKRRTWEMFVRWLMFGGLVFGLILIAVLAFVYSGYP